MWGKLQLHLRNFLILVSVVLGIELRALSRPG